MPLPSGYGRLIRLNVRATIPWGGLVNTTPLAVKAGLGGFGKNGLLISKDYGQRQRTAPIFIDAKLFEYSHSQEYQWIKDFCPKCHKCVKSCPTGAIYSENICSLKGHGAHDALETSIDREKCYPQFSKTAGCGICMSACPFSRGGGTYETLKNAHHRTLDK